jgi:hypothetical protein
MSWEDFMFMLFGFIAGFGFGGKLSKYLHFRCLAEGCQKCWSEVWEIKRRLTRQ